MHLHVAFTPAEATRVPTGIVVDVLRATSSIAQALAGGYERILCCSEVDEARALRDEIPGSVLAGERWAGPIEGFDLGNSPQDFVEPRGETLILTTTNGTRAIVAAAADCDEVLVGSLLNLDAVASAARERGEDVEVVCAGVDGRFTLDDAYCAGRIVELLEGERTDSAEAALRIARSFGSAEEGLRASKNPHEFVVEHDLEWCARESVLDVVPRFTAMRGPAAEIVRA
ncbi:MAG TPA: 2-phosphosulfolactate phosphatase [Gaiellaceae bacterium]